MDETVFWIDSLSQIITLPTRLRSVFMHMIRLKFLKGKSAKMDERMTKKKEIEHINYALVEDTRPAMYRSMKYWGKKPHNIWSQFIEAYTEENDVVLDPFAGSNVAAFEAAKLNRKCFSFDLNPLSSFIIEVMNSSFDRNLFIEGVKSILHDIKNDPVYKDHYTFCEGEKCYLIFNYRWEGNEVVKVCYKTIDRTGSADRCASDSDRIKAKEMCNINIPYWFPTESFPSTPSIKQKFINDIGGNGYQHLWTKRNLYLLSLIFDKIIQVRHEALKLQLLFGFIQTLHLTSKMVVPRSEQSNREFSGSWGRADYMIRKRQMEQNPVIVFERSCFDKQGVLSALEDYNDTFRTKLRITELKTGKAIPHKVNIVYGVLDVVDLSKYVKPKSVDFIITDPPYAGLVQYLDLSMIWLVWLQHVNAKYLPEFKSEITIKEGLIGRPDYRRKLQKAFKEMYTVLKDDGYLVVTFHHQDINEWNEFINAVKLSGFKFDKVTHQYNKRSGEANVSNPYGTSGADFYIRCSKQRNIDFSDDASSIDDFIVQKTMQIIAQRNEPTKYDFLIAGLLPEMIQAGFVRPADYMNQISQTLAAFSTKTGILTHWKNENDKAGEYWWFTNPEKHIINPDLPLSDRIEETIVAILRRKLSVKFDDILAELFRTYPNGLTPDPRNLMSILKKYAYQSSTYWKLSPEVQTSINAHNEKIYELIKIGKRIGFSSHVGFRERSELCSTSERLDHYSLPRAFIKSLQFDEEKISRIQMIDLIWFGKDNSIQAIFEVENSTNFISAIVRGSNLDSNTVKFMIIPDERSTEFNNIKDPLFIQSFKDNGWLYLYYSDIVRLARLGNPTISDMIKASIELD